MTRPPRRFVSSSDRDRFVSRQRDCANRRTATCRTCPCMCNRPVAATRTPASAAIPRTGLRLAVPSGRPVRSRRAVPAVPGIRPARPGPSPLQDRSLPPDLVVPADPRLRQVPPDPVVPAHPQLRQVPPAPSRLRDRPVRSDLAVPRVRLGPLHPSHQSRPPGLQVRQVPAVREDRAPGTWRCQAALQTSSRAAGTAPRRCCR